MLNGTLIVQAGNFFIAYLIIKYIFLRPALRIILQEEAQSHALNREIVDLKQELAEQEIQQKKAWQKCVQDFSVEKPTIIEDVSLPQINVSDDLEMPSETAQEKIVDDLVEKFVTRITKERGHE